MNKSLSVGRIFSSRITARIEALEIRINAWRSRRMEAREGGSDRVGRKGKQGKEELSDGNERTGAKRTRGSKGATSEWWDRKTAQRIYRILKSRIEEVL